MLDSNQHRRFWRPPCYRLHQCHIPDLVNVQVGKTFGMVEWVLPPTARNVYVVHPFGRASPSVINRLIKAGSLLSPTCSSGDIRAIPSISQAATPMKPRANLRNRTRQPKGCANRIAKPAHQCRTSQNHLMMIILNKTGATTVAQLKTTGIQQCNNAKTAPFQRFLDTVTAIQNLLPAAFGVSTRDPAALFFVAGGHSPTGVFVVWCNIGTFVRWYECSFVHLYACASLRHIPYYLYLSRSIFFVRILVSCLTLFFPVVSTSLFLSSLPLTMFRHADRTALFQRFAVVCFLDLLTPLLVCIVIAINRLGSQPSKVGATL